MVSTRPSRSTNVTGARALPHYAAENAMHGKSRGGRHAAHRPWTSPFSNPWANRRSLDAGVVPAAPEPEMPTFPDWWRWDLTFTSHAELRMEHCGVTEVEVRAMLEGATGFAPSVVEGRFMIHARHPQRP